MIDISSELEKQLSRMSRLLRSYVVRQSHSLGDVPLYLHARDVREHCRATIELRKTSVSRAGFATARSAFESAIDMALLVSHTDGYLVAGAATVAYSYCDTDKIRDAWAASEPTQKDAILQEVGRADDEVELDATFLDYYSPGSRLILTDSYERMRAEFSKKRTPSHWSGKSVRDRIELSEKTLSAIDNPTLEEVGVVFTQKRLTAWYSMMSAQCHPGVKLRDADVELDVATGVLKAARQAKHKVLPESFSFAAAVIANYVLENRDALTVST